MPAAHAQDEVATPSAEAIREDGATTDAADTPPSEVADPAFGATTLPRILEAPEPVPFLVPGDAPTTVATVRFVVALDEDGTILEVTPQDGADEASVAHAEALVRQTRFAPATRDGRPVPSRFTFEQAVVFRGEDAVVPVEDDDPLVISVYAETDAEALRRSAYVVSVVETETAQRESADLGAVLARDTPVSVQRTSGLGSRTNLSLAGLGGERLRFFLDGVPLEFLGHLAGTANVPLNLVDRIEVYQGAVPVHLAGDALGGAVNLVTDDRVDESRWGASYQYGSFHTHRATLSGRYVHEPTGVFARVDGFYDTTANDYLVDVQTWDDRGKLTDVTVPRFHDGYRAGGVTAAIGVAGRPWADRLVVQGFFTDFHNDVQHGVTMARPYGEVTFDRRAMGGNLKYAVGEGRRTRFDVVAGYARLEAVFQDLSNCLYDWTGRCTPRSIEGVRGEISGQPVDRLLTSDTGYVRAHLQHHLHPRHRLRLALATTYSDRRGENRTLSPEYDPLLQPRTLSTSIVGAELESRFLDDRLVNVVSLKGYLLAARSHELLSTGAWADRSVTIPNGGAGDTLRVRLAPGLYAKASYEYATRLPTLDELFGDGMFVVENLELRPETSHNANLGVQLEDVATVAGAFRAKVHGFGRWSDHLIAQLVRNEVLQNVNVWSARALGVEARLGYTTPGDWIALDGSTTFQDIRNTSTEGELASRAGDRIPNMPYLFADASLRFHADRVLVPTGTFELTTRLRYVHEFFLGWESYAQEAERLTVPDQLTLALYATYVVRGAKRTFSTSFGVENLTDADTWDFYGLQRPGRAFFAKWTVQ